MRKLTLLTIFAVVAMNGFGQSISTSSSKLLIGTPSYNKISPGSYQFTGGKENLLKIQPMPASAGYPIDSLILYVNKRQVRWVNDSTLVIKKETINKQRNGI